MGFQQIHRKDQIENGLKLLRARIQKRRNVLAIAVRGSYVTGLMTPTSDVDIFVIQKRKLPIVELKNINGIEFHIRSYPPEYFEYMLHERNLRFIGFFIHSAALWDPLNLHKKYSKIVRNLSAQDLMQFWYPELLHHRNDAVGQIKIGNFETATFILQRGAHFLAQLVLLQTQTPTYKYKDVITLIKKSSSLDKYKSLVMEILSLNEVDEISTSNNLKKFNLLLKTFKRDSKGRVR